jgi:hypothetical protein
MRSNDLDWERVTAEAVRILTCEQCTTHAVDGLPQPFWVGEDYRPGGVVLVARNPASKELPTAAKRILQRLSDRRDQTTFIEWSRWRIEHVTGKPWRQWSMAFAKAVGGCQTPEQLAWLKRHPHSLRPTTPPPASRHRSTAATTTWLRC